MLFIGLGTSMGSVYMIDGKIIPLALGHLQLSEGETLDEHLSRAGLKEHGTKTWRRGLRCRHDAEGRLPGRLRHARRRTFQKTRRPARRLPPRLQRNGLHRRSENVGRRNKHQRRRNFHRRARTQRETKTRQLNHPAPTKQIPIASRRVHPGGNRTISNLCVAFNSSITNRNRSHAHRNQIVTPKIKAHIASQRKRQQMERQSKHRLHSSPGRTLHERRRNHRPHHGHEKSQPEWPRLRHPHGAILHQPRRKTLPKSQKDELEKAKAILQAKKAASSKR